jgi:predicted nucleotidyltransferase
MTHQLKTIQEKVTPIFLKYPVIYAGVFGSFARGEENKESDVDIMIRLEPDKSFSLFDLVGLQLELAENIGREVDLVTEKGIDKYIRKYIIRDLLPIYSR